MGNYCDEHEWRHATEPCPTCAKRDAVYDAAMARHRARRAYFLAPPISITGTKITAGDSEKLRLEWMRSEQAEYDACRKAEEVERG